MQQTNVQYLAKEHSFPRKLQIILPQTLLNFTVYSIVFDLTWENRAYVHMNFDHFLDFVVS